MGGLPKQTTFSDAEFTNKRKQTRRDRFLAEIEAVTPWPALVAALLPYYPKGDGRGRPPVGLERMLRMYIAQQCFGLSDEGIEDAIYDSQAIRGFVGIDLTHESAPDATTLLKFRRLLEKHNLTRRIFDEINGHLASKGLMMREGTIVDATLIAAPPSTKNRDEKRDPEMHQSKKGKNWFFGMKAHIGVDAKSGLAHTLVTTAGNVSDVTQTHKLLHGDETMVFGDAGYQGADKRPENAAKAVTWHIAMKRSARKAMKKNPLGRMKEKLEKAKASVRAKVEHPFHVLKNLFRHRKTRYRGLAKNTAQLHTLFAFANLVLAGRTFGGAHARTPS
ncbi:IS5 family transposase [Massilia varians]|uniref:IS5 family transposase n=1 Tax=Massilia varians TaxID=457921 RepID=A0ABN6TD28_9BURK|nr:IS5 family transposase [Massilia varians]BDT58106.1 IS5 family transposase [Massilia varians]